MLYLPPPPRRPLASVARSAGKVALAIAATALALAWFAVVNPADAVEPRVIDLSRDPPVIVWLRVAAIGLCLAIMGMIVVAVIRQHRPKRPPKSLRHFDDHPCA